MDPAQWPLKAQPRKFLRAKFTDAGRQGSKLKPGFVLISGKNHTHHRRTSHPLPPSSENPYSGENWHRGSFLTCPRAAGAAEGVGWETYHLLMGCLEQKPQQQLKHPEQS